MNISSIRNFITEYGAQLTVLDGKGECRLCGVDFRLDAVVPVLARSTTSLFYFHYICLLDALSFIDKQEELFPVNKKCPQIK